MTTSAIVLPTDAELERIADYVSGAMSSEEREAFRTQLRTDAQFFYRVAPVLDLWYSTPKTPAVKTRKTSTGVTLRLPPASSNVTRLVKIGIAANITLAAGLYSAPGSAAIERVALGPQPPVAGFKHRPWQPRTVAP